MAAQVTTSLLMSELGSDFVKAHEASKNVQPNTGNTLPGGLKGIAQLRECCIKKIAKGKKDEGKLMFYADAIIQTPTEFGGYTIRGKRTFITEPIYNTPTRTRKTVKDHLSHVYKILQMLGVKTESLPANMIEQAMQALKNPKNPIYFEFHTWQPPKATEGQYAGKDSMVVQFWDERVSYKPTVSVESIVKAELPEVGNDTLPDLAESPDDGENGIAHTDPINDATSTMDTVTTVINPEDVDSGDIHSLAKKADDSNDLQACNRLTEMAKNAGIPQDDMNNAPSWADLVKLILSHSSKSNGLHTLDKAELGEKFLNVGKDKEPESMEIGIGDHVAYRPKDETGKPQSPVHVEIIEFNADATKVKLRRLDIKRIVYKEVPIGEIEEIK